MIDQDKCTAHSRIEEKLNNVEKALLQVMKELEKRKLTPGAVWAFSIMSSALGFMGMYILNNIE